MGRALLCSLFESRDVLLEDVDDAAIEDHFFARVRQVRPQPAAVLREPRRRRRVVRRRRQLTLVRRREIAVRELRQLRVAQRPLSKILQRFSIGSHSVG